MANIMYLWRIHFGFGQDLGIYTGILKFIGANTLFLKLKLNCTNNNVFWRHIFL